MDEFKENEDLPNTTNPDDWARISGKKGERIVYIRTLITGGQGWTRDAPSTRWRTPVSTCKRQGGCGCPRRVPAADCFLQSPPEHSNDANDLPTSAKAF
ncbi:Proteasome-associated ATPase [Streptomyces hirsutus]